MVGSNPTSFSLIFIMSGKETGMKAVTYYEKYKQIMVEDNEETCKNHILSLFKDFCEEMEVMVNTHHVGSDEAMISLIREQNQKWNALSNIFIKHHGLSPLKNDAFKLYWSEKMPEIYLRNERRRK